MFIDNRSAPYSDEKTSSESDEELHSFLPNDDVDNGTKQRAGSFHLATLISLTFNFILASALIVIIANRKPADAVTLPSVSRLPYDQPTIYHHRSTFWSANDSAADALWDTLSTDHMAVAIPDEWAQAHGLPVSARWPWDVNRGRYFIKGVHDLHCLKYIRRYITNFERGEPQIQESFHTMHCLDALRQSVMCRADDTLMPTSDDSTFALGDRQDVKCRSWDSLIAWSTSPEREACQHSISDYKHIHNSIERYAFCPESSPYKKIADEYFEKHGHLNPWA